MKLKKLLPFLALSLSLIFSSLTANATHIMGGEITWECLPNGQYVFTLKAYRDCNGINFNTNGHALEVHNYPVNGAISQIPLNFVSVTDITPACEGSPCATLTVADPDIPGAIEEYVMVSNPVTLNGVPGANGWIFTWTYGDRNAAIDNIVNAQNFGMTLRAKMYAFNGQNANNCFDSSPDFFQKPSTIICAGGQFTYNHSAFDNELDSLAYSWAQPLDGNFCNPPPCILGGLYLEGANPPILNMDAASGFSFDSPFPDTNLDARNVPAQLDPETGEITFTSYNQGEYVSVIKVEAWRCGQLIAEIYRELQTVITSGCSANLPPDVPPPFANGTFKDTVKVGDFINFDLTIYDTLRTGNPKADSLFVFASGQQFGAGQTDSTIGCDNPPCATLNAMTPDTGVGTYTTNFRWQTTCTHIASYTPVCNTDLNTYLFTIRAFDDYCPAAGQTIASVFITILAEEQVESPDIHCADVQANGDVIIDWNQTADPDNSFEAWMIYSSTNRNGPYTIIDSVLNYNQTTYTHVGAGANAQSIHYMIRARSGCTDGWTILPADTISTIYHQPTFNNSCVELNWNELDDPWPDGSGANYYIFREYPIGGGFTLYDSSATEFYCDTFNVCTDTVTYRIQLTNTGNGCTGSNSNVAGIRFTYPDPLNDPGTTTDLCTGQSLLLGGAPTSSGNVTYQWSPATFLDDATIANPTASPLDTITYSLTVTDDKGCISIDSITLNTSVTPVTDAGIDSTRCVENFPLQLYGSVTETNSGRWIGGSGTFTPNRNTLNADYQPSIAEINAGFTNLQLISTNIGVCDQDTDQVRINIVRFIGTPIATVGNVSCNGASDGTISINATGGFTPYNYVWDDGPTTPNRTNLSAGTYTVTINNTFGCDSAITVVVSEPAILSSSITASSDASCNGFNDGSATVTPAGGTAPYTYLWNDASNSTTATVNNLLAGSYQVTIIDNNGCSVINTATNIGEPSQLIAAANLVSNVSCFNGNDGEALASASGGTLPYTFIWDDPTNSTAPNLTTVTIGTYHVTITDNNGCSDSASITITEPGQLTASVNSSTNTRCNGFSNGAARVFANGGTTPYTYLWNNAANTTTDTVFGLTSGTYTVTVTDNEGCTTDASIVITDPPTLTSVVSSSTNVSCNGLTDGSAVASANGGTPPYNFLWNDPSVTALDTLRNVAAGTYTATITDNNGCTITSSITISEPTALSSTISSSTDVSCNGLSDGSATVSPSGGTAPYTYLWNDASNSTTATANNLSAGSYQVTITDNNGCSIVNSTATINQPQTLIASTNLNNNVSCFGGNDGSALATVSGGTLPYTFQWDDPGNTTTANVSSLTIGTYHISVTDNNGCTDSASITITEPSQLNAAINSSSDASCNGLSDGGARVFPTGGTAPYTYLWNNIANSTTDTIDGLPAGTYTVTVTDNLACSLTASIVINEPNILTSSIGGSSDVSCFGFSDGSAFVSATGGTPPYNYLWSDPAATTLDTLRNVTAGTYTVTVSDLNSCTSTITVNIGEPPLLLANINDSTNASCFGLSDGMAAAVGIGGIQPYNFLWSDIANTADDSLMNVESGTYTISITDANNCVAIDSIRIGQPDSLEVVIASLQNASCFGFSDGRAVANVIGGTPNFAYQWNDPANTTNDSVLNLSAGRFTLTVSDQNNCTDTTSVLITEPTALSMNTALLDSASCFGSADGRVGAFGNGGTQAYTFQWGDPLNSIGDSISSLAAGKYYVTLTDQNSCTLIDSIIVEEPDSLILGVASIIDASCNGLGDGIASTNTSGGTSPYTYSWNNNSNNDSLINVSSGVYTATVTDRNQCTDTTSVFVGDPLPLSATIDTSINVSCFGLADGSALAQASGGTAPYTYFWNDPQATDSSFVENLSAGTYEVRVVDAQSCVTTTTVQITEPQTLQIALANSINVSCLGFSDGSASFSTSGGTAPYTYFWSNNADSSFADNLVAGTYFVTVTDANFCTDVDSVIITQPAGMSLSLSADSISCFGFNDGFIQANLNGGTTPYNYLWSNNRTTPSINNLTEGEYSLTVTDLNGCTVADTTNIIEPEILGLSLTNTDTICVNSNKLIVATATGGTGAYQYTWNNNLGASSFINVQPTQTTTYSVSVTDANSCPTVSESVEVGVRNIFNENVALISSGNICTGEDATLTPQFNPSAQAIGPYTYQWNEGLSGENAQIVSPDTSTLYILNIVDACNNSIADSTIVEVSDPPEINIGDTLIQGCDPLTVQFDNGTPLAFNYFWDFGDGNTSREPTPRHTYTTVGEFQVDFQVSTPQGCESDYDGNFRVIVLPSPSSEFSISPTVTTTEEPIVNATTDISDATTWFWTFGDGDSSILQNPSHEYADTGRYTISLYKENSFGCRDTGFAVFIVEPSYEIRIPNVFTPSIGGASGGQYDPNNPNNTVFFPFVEFVEDYRLLIFNRWGEVVFESTDQRVGWDGYYKGELCQADVYVYKLELRFINGESATKVGDLTLLR